ncbi:MAG: class I SAM-dependent methyltransferase [Methylophaga sp.]|jgi:tRNA (cmo5U34)-methyltransferase|uniref:class I SAM-dependent methyltransferase n=1 Tax=Methylophaga sp. TaxID=2024840 RepID=UPI000C0F634C|nr:class I SAM-dependent methyltransferase [Methylophaga sp.]MBL1457332.1 class I SAM-dependent methyltransferase [Methylophaga sp.]
MQPDEIKEIFDQQASSYDQQWARMSPINNALYFLLESVFAELVVDAQILCVGAGTGKELIHLARKFPHWQFTAVEPSGAMLAVCQKRVEEEGMTSRCYFHEGYLDSLANNELYDAATCFLVSQFIVEQPLRTELFGEIARRLKPGGILASADLASELGSDEYEALLHAWMTMMAGAGIPADKQNQIRDAYAKDVAILPPAKVESIIKSAGFYLPVQFFQAGLIHAWFAKRQM